jgi:predicted PurR-regulated permease PerM
MFLSDLSIKYEINFGGLQTTLTEFSSNIISSLGNIISDGAISVVNSSVNVITTGIVVICSAVYFLIDMDKIREGIKKYFNRKSRRTGLYLIKLDDELTKYIGGMGMTILIQIIEYTLAFLLIGHPNYLILGILSGISAIIPWFGGFLVAIISLLVSSVISAKMFLLTVVICIVCPILDGNVIGPKVYGKTNNMHPLLVIFAVSAGGALSDDMDARLFVLAAVETGVVKTYQCIPWATSTVCSLYSQKVTMGTTTYNIMYGYGGVRHMTYNFTDAEWDAYVAEQGGTLSYE